MLQTFVNGFFAVKMFPFIFIATFIFACRMQRRKYYWPMFFGILIAGTAGFYFLWDWISGLSWDNQAAYFALLAGYNIGLFLFMWGCALLLTKSSLAEGLMWATGGFLTEHISGSLAILVGLLFGVDGIWYRDYSVAFLFITLVCYGAVCLVIWLIFRYAFSQGRFRLKSEKLVILTLLMLLMCTYLSILSSYLATTSSELGAAVCRGYDVACCVYGLLYFFSVFESGQDSYRMAAMEEIERQRARQYEVSQDSIDLINTKCHDLKKMIAQAMNSEGLKADMAAIDEKLNIYDAMVRTGNRAFDLVVSEKSLYCEAHGISLSVMADGEAMGFFREMEIYSLFGNILDNAIEAVVKLGEGDRVVSLSVCTEGRLLRVHEDNPYEGEVILRGGMPVSSKGDSDNHGYGFLSMRRVVDSYGGGLAVSAKEGVFALDIVIPIPAAEEKERKTT